MLGRGEPSHVLNKSEYRFVDALVAEHVHALFNIGQSDILWRADYDRSLKRNIVYEAYVYVSCSRRHIYKEEIECSPTDLQYHLFQSIACHGAAPDECLFRFCEITYGHPFHAIFFHRHDDFLFAFEDCIGNETFGGCHLRNGRAIYISIGKSDLVSQTGKGYGEIYGNGGFSHAPLAGSYAYYMLHASYFFKSEVQTRFLLGRSCFLDYGLDFHHCVFRSISYDSCLGASYKVFGQRVTVLCKSEGEGDCVSGDFYVLHHPEFYDVLVTFCRVFHFPEPVFYNVLVHNYGIHM